MQRYAFRTQETIFGLKVSEVFFIIYWLTW